LSNSCCIPGAYNGYNLLSANPFDQRIMPCQANLWCSNELILKDKDLRCKARIQPLDILLNNATKLSKADYTAKGLRH
jgi:hypothetical protein